MKYPNLEAEMKRRNISQVDLAHGLGLHVSGISLALRGGREISVTRAKTIRDRFFPGMTIDYLFDEEIRTA